MSVKLVTHGNKLTQVFEQVSIIIVLASYCSNIVRQHKNVETCSKPCASFLTVSHQLFRLLRSCVVGLKDSARVLKNVQIGSALILQYSQLSEFQIYVRLYGLIVMIIELVG